jgi:hypothetical protein
VSAFYIDNLKNHNQTPIDQIVGNLAREYGKYHLDLKKQQTQTWIDTIEIFKKFFKEAKINISNIESWGILYEYKIPRRSKRVDVVLLSENLIFVLEIKNHQEIYNSVDIAQLEDYCLDLRDFHFESKDRIIIPILLCTNAPTVQNEYLKSEDFVQKTLFANSTNLSIIIQSIVEFFFNNHNNINLNAWNNSKYSPTPTIIEMAQMLYSGQSVSEISRHGADNLTDTTNAVLDAIRQAQATNSKAICFITGIPGAGKTLAGLNIVHNREFQVNGSELGVFLSGNSPLVKVLSEALARDFSKREKETKNEAKRRVKTFIYNVHEFIDDLYADKTKVPESRVIIYDEAQRAWTKEQKKKKSNGEITESEPEILFSIMNRLDGWGIIIALVGGGQEINTGEAGLREWGNSIAEKFINWKVYISPELKQGDYSTGNITLFDKSHQNISIVENEFLHLKISLRSYKAKDLSKWVALLLEGKSEEAKILKKESLNDFPVFITRNLDVARTWLKKKARGTRRTGLVASSGGRRLKAFGYDPFHGLRGDSSQDELGAWYLNPSNDIRSSNFLEIIATEYAVQGLEIDWAGIFWDADLRRKDGNWDFKQFKGTNWQNVSDDQDQRKQFMINKYRVLLTRAREGMIIWVPFGDDGDRTRLKEFYDETFNYLKSCGISEI